MTYVIKKKVVQEVVDVRIYVERRIIGLVCDVVVVWQHVTRSFLPSSRKSGREEKKIWQWN
jgi:hypothetical protein